MPELPIVVVGLPGPRVDADLVVGGRRHLEGLPGRRLVIGGEVAPVLDAIAAEPGRVCVLASGDPGFFGIVRALADRFGPDALDVRPAVSSVSTLPAVWAWQAARAKAQTRWRGATSP